MIQKYEELKIELPEIYKQLKFDWGSSGITNKNYIMAWLIWKYNLQTTLDLGVFYGGSLFTQAYIHNKYTNGIVYGVDPYTKEDFKQFDADSAPLDILEAYADRTDFNEIYNSVVVSIANFGYEKNINLIRQRSDKAINYFKENSVVFDYILIDGNHDTINVMSDVNLYFPLVKENGYIILDDIHYASVKPAYNSMKEKALLCYEEPYFAVFQKSDNVNINFKLLIDFLKTPLEGSN